MVQLAATCRLLLALLVVAPLRCTGDADRFLVGTGIYDITGPVVEVPFMGYASPEQKGAGIHFRIRARAYVVAKEGGRRVAFVSTDSGMGSDLLNSRVVELLARMVGPGIYTHDNICISGTHTHSTPAGFHQYVLTQVTSLGFVRETADALAIGCAEAIAMAHNNTKPSRIRAKDGMLTGANINRSPTSYVRNPKEEQQEYAAEGDTDKSMLLLRFDSESGEQLGMLNWFAVHGTSMNNTNLLVSGDNKGYASYLFERNVNGPGSTAGKGPFVAAFASTNLGDVSPNTRGPHCLDTGLPCDADSRCNGRAELCVAFGPGTNGDMLESTEIIGRRQFEHARALYEAARDTPGLEGDVDFRHAFLKMRGREVRLQNGSVGHVCGAAMGYAFAAGTTDGPGMFDFFQGENSTNPFWKLVSSILSAPTKEQVACHAPKPILLNLQALEWPYRWEPPTLPIQVLRIGQLFILGVPGEFTTMAGRRLRKAVKQLIVETLAAQDKLSGRRIRPTSDIKVTIAGLANSYSHYITTYEEYQNQRYEAASTLYGPHTLEAYIQEFRRIVGDLLANRSSTSDEAPPNKLDNQVSLLPGVVLDLAPLGHDFGSVREDAHGTYGAGKSAVKATFQSGNPRNNLRTQGTFLTVERQEGTNWTVVATDGDWETKFRWRKDGAQISENPFSLATVEWEVPESATAGTYRLCHFGDYKDALLRVHAYSGCSSPFQVSAVADAGDIHV